MRRWLPSALAIVAVTVVLRLPAFWTPILDVDESQFAGFADAILSGGIPYVASVDTKPPGISYFYAAIFSLFGRNNMIAVHAATALVVALTAWNCLRIGRRVFSERAGVWAALLYAVFTTAQFPKFIATSIAIVMMLPLAASIDALLSWEKSGRRLSLFFSGVLWGIACLFKYQAGIGLVIAAAYLLFIGPLFGEGRGWGRRVRDLLVFIAGGAGVAALGALFLFRIGAWEAFVLWSIKGSGVYVGAATALPGFWEQLFLQSRRMIAWGLPMWGLAGLGIILVIKDRVRAASLILLWLLLSIVPVSVGGKFYEHYFLQLFPPLCILGGEGATALLARCGRIARPVVRRSLVALFALGLIAPAALAFAMRLDPSRINAMIDEETPTDYEPIGRYLREHTREGDRIFVWGFATPIYFFSGRAAASRFLWTDWQTGRVSGKAFARGASFDPAPHVWPGSWEMLFADLDRSRPVSFVDTSPGDYHNYGRYPVSKYPELVDYLRYRYRFEANVKGAIIYRRNAP